MTCIMKMACRRGKRIEIWVSGVDVIFIWGTFDLLVFNILAGDHSVHVFQNGLYLGNSWPQSNTEWHLGPGRSCHMYIRYI